MQLNIFPEQVPQTPSHTSQFLFNILGTVIPEGQTDRQFPLYKKVPFTHEIHADALLQARHGFGQAKQLNEELA